MCNLNNFEKSLIQERLTSIKAELSKLIRQKKTHVIRKRIKNLQTRQNHLKTWLQ